MKTEDVKKLVSYRMEKSKDAIKAAEILLQNEMLSFSINRVYYSMFYAVQALLAVDGVSFSKHGQVKGYFNRELIKTMILSKELGQFYNKAFEYRQKFDYVDFAVPDRQMVLEYIEKSKNFYKEIEKYLQSKLEAPDI
jgi:uncharacterized protein (UPF0332 family)